MSHRDRRPLSEKQNALNTFSNKAKVKSCSKDVLVSCCKSVCITNRTEDCSVSQKVKRLKTRKERNQIRGHDTNNSYQKHQQKQGSKEKAQNYNFQDYPSGHLVKHFQKERAALKPIPPQQLSLITEGRLTSIRGLFSHQVRSVDIERLVKNQKKRHRSKEHKSGQDTLNDSPSLPSHSPLIFKSKSSECGRCIEEQQKSKRSRNILSQQTDTVTLYKTDRKYISAQSLHEAVDNTIGSSSPCSQRGMEPVVLSSLESECDHNTSSTIAKANCNKPHVTPKMKDTLKSLDQEQTTKTTTAIDKRHGFVNTQSSPTKSVLLGMCAPHSDSGNPSFITSSPALDREHVALADECHGQNQGVVGRLAARLCQTLNILPQRRRCPLLTESREVLLQTLQERHSSQLQHSLCRLRSYISAERPRSSHNTEQACNDSGQRCEDNTLMGFSHAWKNEDSQQNANIDSWTDDGSQRKYMGAKWNTMRQAWGTYSPHDLGLNQQLPFQDMLDQGTIRAQSQESLRGEQHFDSQRFPMHQDFTVPEILTSSYQNWEQLTSNPLSLLSRKQVKLGSSEMRSENCNELFEQWRSKPDLGFLFYGKNMNRTHAPLDHLTELKNWSPQHKLECFNERSPFGASSTVSGFFPPEGFRYEPYYRFPHPLNSINSSERSAMTLYIQSDTERGLSSFLPQSTSYTQY
ncbi:proline-rich protein 19 [Brachyhypopomus gauderio]|uniref:proline-rich protein 19 n=1 Tax=Brachyhypopomus gauderio TaxID=698409 RepID=UPI0040438102